MKKDIVKLTPLLKVLLLLICTMNSLVARGQTNRTAVNVDEISPKQESPLEIYKVHLKWEVPVSLALIGAASLGYKWMDKRASLSADQVANLNPSSINAFDRHAAFYNPAGFNSAQSKSDFLMTAFVASPLLLVFDKRIRRDWEDMLGMLLVAHGVDNTIFFSSILIVRRPRPLTYNPALSVDARTGVGKTNSFPSGHVSWTATSTFFIAKVYTDYHHIKGWKRMAFFTGAALPPVLIGYYRVHAGRHFTSDAIIGGLLGAACGIAVPELHRIKDKAKGLAIQPFSRYGANGLSVSYLIR